MGFFGYIFLIVIVFVILFFVVEYKGNVKVKKWTKQELNYYDLNYKYASKGVNATTSKQAKKCFDMLTNNYPGDNNISSPISQQVYHEDMRDVKDNYEALARYEWETKAGKILDKFLDLYIIITDPDFRDIEKAYRSKNRCLKYWQDFFLSKPDEIYDPPKEFMRKYLGEYYDDCMFSQESLDKRLSECIEQMKPEYKRKMALVKQMLDYVACFETGIMRTQLFSSIKGEYSDAEIKYCYKELIEKYKLSEVKIGGRFFVYLSEKEKQKRKL